MKIQVLVFNLLCTFFCSTAFAQIVNIDDSSGTRQNLRTILLPEEKANVKLKPIPVDSIALLDSLFRERFELNRKYMMSLDNDKLLQNFYYEAGLTTSGNIMLQKHEQDVKDFYWGWDSPMNQLRGHFLGHWLSAAAYIYAGTNDKLIKAKADLIVNELAKCQDNNGGQWAGSIPEKYYDLMARGKHIWSPQYTIHKTLMGLHDLYVIAGNEQALEVLDKFADWFHDWTGEQIKNNNAGAIYGGETSGMLEIWANLYALTEKQKYWDLMERYGSPGLFQSLVEGEDPLSNNHANASIPWSHGSARAYEVTGDKHWEKITTAFWKNAVTDRQEFCTGGQNAGEFWIPPGEIDKFAGENNQEHCTVYNMIRTADYLFRWTGDTSYADYIERNIYNGILAQQHPKTGMVAYFLPMGAGYKKGGEKGWGHPTMDFFCCHGSLVQAHTRYTSYIYYESDNGLVVSQYIPSKLNWNKNGKNVTVSQDFSVHQFERKHKRNRWKMTFDIHAESPVDFTIQFRLPWWLKEKAKVYVNGKPRKVSLLAGMLSISRTWSEDEISIEFPEALYLEQLPNTNKYTFMEGPIVLAGITDKEITLKGNLKKPSSILEPEYEQQYKLVRWKQSHYQTKGQQSRIKFVPLYEIGDESYSLYFPIE